MLFNLTSEPSDFYLQATAPKPAEAAVFQPAGDRRTKKKLRCRRGVVVLEISKAVFDNGRDWNELGAQLVLVCLHAAIGGDVNIIYLVYINGQSTKPLVHSIAEAKQFATRNIQYKPSLTIECYSMPHLISKWIYDYEVEKWVEQFITSDLKKYELMEGSRGT